MDPPAGRPRGGGRGGWRARGPGRPAQGQVRRAQDVHSTDGLFAGGRPRGCQGAAARHVYGFRVMVSGFRDGVLCYIYTQV